MKVQVFLPALLPILHVCGVSYSKIIEPVIVMVMVANLYFILNVADIMLTVTPRDECCCNLHISDDATEAVEKLLT